MICEVSKDIFRKGEKCVLKKRSLNKDLVFFRLRVLSDLESQLQAQNSELQSLRDLRDEQEGGENPLQELETQYEETERALTDR